MRLGWRHEIAANCLATRGKPKKKEITRRSARKRQRCLLDTIKSGSNDMYKIRGPNSSHKTGSIREDCPFLINMHKVISTGNVKLFFNTLPYMQANIFSSPCYEVSSVGPILCGIKNGSYFFFFMVAKHYWSYLCFSFIFECLFCFVLFFSFRKCNINKCEGCLWVSNHVLPFINVLEIKNLKNYNCCHLNWWW